MVDFKKELKHILVQYDMQMKDVYNGLNTSNQNLNRILNGDLKLSQMQKIADVVNCDLVIKLERKKEL